MTQTDTPVVGILHPGRMGAAIAAQSYSHGASVLWCPTDRSASTAQRAADAGLEEVQDLAELLNRADILLSICPPAAAEEIAQAVASHRYAGTFVEANAISPARCTRIVTMVQDAGARVVDGAIFGPPPTEESSVRLYLAGKPDDTRLVAQLFAGTTVRPVVLNRQPPVASALKIADASYHKAARALAAVAHALAAEYGVTEHLIAEADRIPASPLADPGYLPGVAARAWRWAPELLEAADALAEADLPPQLAKAASEVLSRWDTTKDNWHISFLDVLGLLRTSHVNVGAAVGGGEAPAED